jgi:hypothetical protein
MQDATIQKIRSTIPRKTRLIEFGSRISIGIVDSRRKDTAGCHSEAEVARCIPTTGLYKLAAREVALYDTQGCLSPQCFFVPHKQADAFARFLAKELAQLDSSLPMKDGEDLFEAESFWQKWKFRESQGQCSIYAEHVILQKEGLFEPSGLRRMVFVIPFKNPKEISKRLGKWKNRTSTIARPSSCRGTACRAPTAIKGVRCTNFGEMHEPPPSWKNGGIDLLQRLSS